ncbi:Penicillin-binding protein E [Luteitalea pratensis]|uniref:Penicillin-binding protein E n=1 Tax=Luteitalea pratensis TaxID=1855912 RepID=A0A143PFP5_LUTPR|nr:serine hydrolase [Luteitalea pratensis]AMY07083.1 Penicillin-binding protein E [Luteitalea pratensis]
MTRLLHALATTCSLAALLVSLPAAPAFAQPAAAELDAVVTAAFVPDQPGGAVLVVKDGKVLFRKAIGMASMELGVPLQPDTIFRLGSITKQFTAAAIMMLVEEGKVSLTDPVEKYVPGYPTQGHVITVEHLLTHTSGIQSYTDIPGWFPGRIRADMAVLDLVDAFKKEPMQFAPGTRYAYNNSAYVLLGAIIEKAAGTTYEQFLTTRIFTPLGMTRTFYGSNEPIIRGRAQGYTRDDGVVKNSQFLSMTQPYAAGSLVSTLDDLARWDAALYTDRVVKAESLARMWTPYLLKDGSSTRYGYGFQVGDMRGQQAIEHGGGIPGFSTYALRLPQEHVYVVVLCNSDNPRVAPGYLARRLAAMAIGKPFPERTAITVESSVLARYVGTYSNDARDVRRTVTVEGSRIYLQRGGRPKVEIKAASATEFFLENSLTFVRFDVSADGKDATLLYYGDGSDTPERSRRISDTAPSAAPATTGPAGQRQP